MIDAIIYTSYAGHTKEYADLMAVALGVEAYNLDEAKTKLSKGSSIVYLGWLLAGIVKGLKKAQKRYNVKAVCGVGMAAATAEETERLAQQNRLSQDKFFLLQGGFDINKLHGIYRFMMGIMVKALKKGITEKIENGTATEIEAEMLEMATTGKDCTSIEALTAVLQYISQE